MVNIKWVFAPIIKFILEFHQVTASVSKVGVYKLSDAFGLSAGKSEFQKALGQFSLPHIRFPRGCRIYYAKNGSEYGAGGHGKIKLKKPI